HTDSLRGAPGRSRRVEVVRSDVDLDLRRRVARQREPCGEGVRRNLPHASGDDTGQGGERGLDALEDLAEVRILGDHDRDAKTVSPRETLKKLADDHRERGRAVP